MSAAKPWPKQAPLRFGVYRYSNAWGHFIERDGNRWRVFSPDGASLASASSWWLAMTYLLGLRA